ncbi:MAG: hypothetical protein RIR12_539 [Bacteroidota bacterium]|jgi:phosphatidate cytidylyltransferase
MALNKQTFITRTLTAIVFAAIMLLGLLWNHWSFFILFSVIHFGCWWEYIKLTERIHRTTLHIYTKLGFMLMGYGGLLMFCGTRYMLWGYSLSSNLFFPFTIAGFLLLVLGIFKQKQISKRSFFYAALGAIYISLSCGMMIGLWQIGITWCGKWNLATTKVPIVLVASIWINDTMAYIVGSLIGKTPLSKISPKKTWEGTIGGIILSVLVVAFLFPIIYTSSISWPLPLFFGSIALIAAITGTFGDLLESKLKRMANVKDSGSIMPGHGGFLDRFDSLLLAIPFVWLYVIFFL